jgi:hypothetical protein
MEICTGILLGNERKQQSQGNGRKEGQRLTIHGQPFRRFSKHHARWLASVIRKHFWPSTTKEALSRGQGGGFREKSRRQKPWRWLVVEFVKMQLRFKRSLQPLFGDGIRIHLLGTYHSRSNLARVCAEVLQRISSITSACKVLPVVICYGQKCNRTSIPSQLHQQPRQP